MPKNFEKRDNVRIDCDCNISYKLAGSEENRQGRCISIGGAGITFVASEHFDSGKAVVVKFTEKNVSIPDITVFIEVIGVTKLDNNSFRIAAVIKSIKGN